MKFRLKQAGFIPGMVIEINCAIAALGLAVVVLWSWSLMKYHPPAIDTMKAELVAPVAATAAMPDGWTVAQGEGGATVIRSIEPGLPAWVFPVLLLGTLVSIFVCPLQWPYWLFLAGLCGVWGAGIGLGGPGNQNVKIAADGSVELRGAARFAAIVVRGETVAAQNVETVLVHKERPEAYVVFRKNDTRRGWRIYADKPADAHAVGVLVQSKLKPPPAAKPRQASQVGRPG
ncbi:MAG TPA: hypothetical protein VFO57_04915 [Burkholderiales bacterium]|nr:hypothetical protein [Burkholderiales bacterium]